MIIRSFETDPYGNLAMEEQLLEQVSEPTLYLWQNQRTIVIGRHQNPWKECRVRELEAWGGHLARRLSGGGAVYHDLGNLNFTFLMSRSDYDPARQTAVLLQAVRALGIDAQCSGRNDLTADGRKFSGNAFCIRKTAAYHHGTLLVDVNKDHMTRFLTASPEKIRSKGVDSVRSRVVNLRELCPALTIPALADALADAFAREYHDADPSVQDAAALHTPRWEELRTRYASWQWRLGETPAFDVQLCRRFPWGEVEILIALQDGCARTVTVHSDAMSTHLPEALAAAFTGLRYDTAVLADAAAALGEAEYADIARWLGEL